MPKEYSQIIKKITNQVFNKLGREPKLQIQTINLYDNRYRINVKKGDNYGLISYFVHISEDGNIIKSSPQLGN